MKKAIALTAVLAFALTAGIAAPVRAQKKFTPKGIWKGMLANVSDVQAMVTALAVFDMKRIAAVADQSAKKQAFVSNLPKYKGTKVGKLYGKLGDAMREVGNAARAGDEMRVAEGIGAVLKACSACHYNVRDAALRK
ncbi:MAG: hypothetical protein ACE5IM_07140 [Nitrospinota bacterium]